LAITKTGRREMQARFGLHHAHGKELT
jgi:hypothetical protein